MSRTVDFLSDSLIGITYRANPTSMPRSYLIARPDTRRSCPRYFSPSARR
ncbi:unnamed protein product [Ectocarpus sp. CCAP 1310/34]|nr:unnamed protein product [Ectocarpus sp. CCAP 1310/34]